VANCATGGTCIPVRSSSPEERPFLVGITPRGEASVSRLPPEFRKSLAAAFTELERDPLPGPYKRPFMPRVEAALRAELKALPPGFKLLSYHYGRVLVYYVVWPDERVVGVIGVRQTLYL
jgi:hypothetical protein